MTCQYDIFPKGIFFFFGFNISSFLQQKQYFQVYNKCKIKHHIITDSFTQIQKQQKRVVNMNLKKMTAN